MTTRIVLAEAAAIMLAWSFIMALALVSKVGAEPNGHRLKYIAGASAALLLVIELLWGPLR